MNQRKFTLSILLLNFYYNIFIGIISIGLIRDDNVIVLFVTGFAAANNNSNKKKKNVPSAITSPTGNSKGFGSIKKESTENFNDVISKFRNRIPLNPSDVICPCGLSNGKSYENCCAPYHNNILQPETPIRVLQTRYTAFKYRIIPYIIQTIHPNNPDYRTNQIIWAKDLNRNGMFDSYDFLGLEDVIQQEQNNNIPDKEEDMNKNMNDIDHNDNEAFMSFKVRLRSKDSKQQEAVIIERSKFLRTEEGKWLYAKGEIRSG